VPACVANCPNGGLTYEDIPDHDGGAA
jgi:hypothetical protein